MVFGDINEELYSREMQGVRERNMIQMRNFRDILKDCSLMDLGSVNGRFTFTNKRKGNQETKARLDRFLANKEWMELLNFQVQRYVMILLILLIILQLYYHCMKVQKIKGKVNIIPFV